MAIISVDMTQAVDFSPIPARPYEVILKKKPVQEESREKKIPGLQWYVEVCAVDGQQEQAGRELRRWTPMIGKGATFTEQVLTAFGIPFEVTKNAETGDVETILFDDDDCLEKRAIATVVQTPGKDKNGKDQVYNNIDSFSSLPQ